MSSDQERLQQLARDGDDDAWRELARLSARRDAPLDLRIIVTPWRSRDEIIEACVRALMEGCALEAGRYSVRPYRGDLSRGAECIINRRTRERWWGGLGAEYNASGWLYDQWMQDDSEVDVDLGLEQPRPA